MDAIQELASPKANDFCDSPLLGVNTPRSDEDRLKLMELMVFLLQRNVCVEIGINAARLSKLLLSGKYKDSFSKGPPQVVSEPGYKKKITSPSQWKFLIHTILQSLSAKRTSWNEFSTTMASAVICLSKGQKFNFSKYIFDSLVRNVDSSSKFYMYSWFIHLIIQTNIADLSTYTTRYIFPALTQKVFANMQRVGKGFSGVETPLFESMLVVRDVTKEAEAQVLATCSALALRVEGLENDKAAQQMEIVKLKARVKKMEKINKVKSSKLKWLKKADIYNIDLDHSSKVLSMQEDDTEVQEAVEIVTTAKLMTEVVTAAASTPIPAVKPKILSIVTAPVVSTRRRKGVVIRDPKEELQSDTPAKTPKVKDEGKGILIEALKPMKKKDQIEMDVEYARKLQEEINKEHEDSYKNVDWNAALDHVQSKEPQYIKRYYGMKKKPQTEFEARKNIIFYLKNTEGYKMDFFKGKKYDEILLIFQAKFDANMRFLFKSREEMEAEDEEIIKSINETPTQKAAKRRKLSEEAQEAEDLRKRLEIVQDKDDDVFVEATPLAQKVPIVDYQIVVINNKPRYKIIRADDTHQFYISFTTPLKNFDRKDLEDLWRI
nr:hypothetical protein [Tanacetum cinerariifolium]